MKMSKLAAVVCASLSSLVLSGKSSGAVYAFDFEGGSVPSAFTLSGSGGAISQTLTTVNSYQGAQALSLNLTCNGAHQNTMATIVLPELVQHVQFAIFDQFAGNSPVYDYFFLGKSGVLTEGLQWMDSGSAPSVRIMDLYALENTRTVGWHVVDAAIGSDTIEYRIDGNLLGYSVVDSTRQVDTLQFQIANAGFYGTNSLLIDSVTITTIPEPSSLLLGGVSALGLLLRRKR